MNNTFASRMLRNTTVSSLYPHGLLDVGYYCIELLHNFVKKLSMEILVISKYRFFVICNRAVEIDEAKHMYAKASAQKPWTFLANTIIQNL